MGKYDDISPDRLRADLVAFAHLILRLEQEDAILTSPADLQRLLGDLRQKLFAYEVRNSRIARPSHREADDDPLLRESLKVVREARRRREEMLREWDGTPLEEEDDDE